MGGGGRGSSGGDVVANGKVFCSAVAACMLQTASNHLYVAQQVPAIFPSTVCIDFIVCCMLHDCALKYCDVILHSLELNA